MSRFFAGPLRLACEGLETRDVPSGEHLQWIVGPGAGGSSLVRIFGTDSIGVIAVSHEFQAYDPAFTGGVRAALADVTGDGVPDAIVVPGRGGGPHVKIVDGTSNTVVASFYAYDSNFRGGLWVAAGDLNGDGRAEVITGASTGGGPHVRAFDLAPNGIVSPRDPASIASFYAYDSTFTGGVTVAAADTDGDGLDEIVTAPWIGGGPAVKVFKASGTRGYIEQDSFFAYDPAYRAGVSLSAGDLNGDGIDEIVTGPWTNGGGQVKVFDPAARTATNDGIIAILIGVKSPTSGSSVAVLDAKRDNPRTVVNEFRAGQVLVSPGSGSAPEVGTFTLNRAGTGLSPVLDGYINAYNSFLGGVFVG